MNPARPHGSARHSLDEQFAAVMAEVRAKAPEMLGVQDPHLHVEHRVERPYSLVARVRVLNHPEQPALYVKVARPRSDAAGEHAFMADRVRRDDEVTRAVRAAMSGEPGLSVVDTILCVPEQFGLVTREAPGETLLAVLGREARLWPDARRLVTLEHTLERVGAWIRAFQATDRTVRSVSLSAMREYLDLRLLRLVSHESFIFTDHDRDAVLRAFDRRAAEVPVADLVGVRIHGDLAPGNILVDGLRITVLDLAMAGLGSRYHDLTHLALHLDLLRAKPQFRPHTVVAMRRALFRGFEPGLQPDSPLLRLMTLQHTVCHLVGLVFAPARLLERSYNAWVARGHRQWIVQFVADASRSASPGQPSVAAAMRSS